jgi:ESS family glutamate:Na+ symporter
MLYAFLALNLAIGLGIHLNMLMQKLGLQLPDFVTCLFAGILLTNIIPTLMPRLNWPSDTPTPALVSEFFLEYL